ncbi:heterokaryon incompatibility protein-domain-containing protein [Annulohypoxylon moriforme]|nr:heterokaryon incompatibility protein-domain-containing protein [Annulohypoxylon moriforme]
MDDINQAHVLIQSGFWESETCFALYPNRTHKLDFSGLDLAFSRFSHGNNEALRESASQHATPDGFCTICTHFEPWLAKGREVRRPPDFYLGRLHQVRRRYRCELCQLVSLVVTLNNGSLNSCYLDSAMVALRVTGQKPEDRFSPTVHVDVMLVKRDSFGWASAEILRLNHAFQFLRSDLEAALPPWVMCKGRRISQQVDLSLLKSWLDSCCETHGPKCSTHILPLHNIYPKNLSVLDLDTMHICAAPEGCSYTALSYVWGKMAPPKAYKILHDGQLVRSYLPVSHELPKTIQDAISLTRGLDVRYLWVDALCIDQEDDDEVREQISQMDRIYSSARLTIVAAYGRDSNAGLPGLAPKSRLVLQSGLSLGSIGLIMSLSHKKAILANTTITDGSWWNQRGWTYQEMLLSRRCLIFTAYQVYFNCRSCTSSEDTVVSERSDYGSRNPIESYAKSNARMIRKGFVTLLPYATVLEQYSTRRLTVGSDCLYACDSALKSLGALMQSPMFWGLPTSVFDAALWWEPDYRDEPGQSRGHRRRSFFPSWSWASIRGKITYQSGGICMEKTCCFYKECLDGTLERIDTNGTRKAYEVKGGLHEEDTEMWNPERYERVPSVKTYTHGSFDALKYTGIIVFWTVITKLSLRLQKDKAADRQNLASCDVFRPDGIRTRLGSFFLPKDYVQHNVESIGEFALIGKLGSDVGLLLITFVGEVAYRVGFVKIRFEEWKVFPRIWKLLRLG